MKLLAPAPKRLAIPARTRPIGTGGDWPWPVVTRRTQSRYEPFSGLWGNPHTVGSPASRRRPSKRWLRMISTPRGW